MRCLDLGARGIKLHPRAQKFSVGDERLDAVFELAVERERPDPDPRRPRPAADRATTSPRSSSATPACA